MLVRLFTGLTLIVALVVIETAAQSAVGVKQGEGKTVGKCTDGNAPAKKKDGLCMGAGSHCVAAPGAQCATIPVAITCDGITSDWARTLAAQQFPACAPLMPGMTGQCIVCDADGLVCYRGMVRRKVNGVYCGDDLCEVYAYDPDRCKP